jgi:ATP-dependent protease Clp ATPase subunit
MLRRGQDAEPLRCSFCRKSQGSVQKLISTPSDNPNRAWICDECVSVCASILEDDRDPSDVHVSKAESHESHPILDHPLTPQLLAAIERWIRQESLGADAAQEFAEVRDTAILLMRPGARNNPPK